MRDVAPYQVLHATDGRTIEVLAGPPTGGPTLLFQPGTAMAPVAYAPFEAAAAARRVRIVQYARPGYAGSGRQPGRRVADAATDVAFVLDALRVERCLSLGWSGGGPHALACAALLPGRVVAVAAVASVAPNGVAGLDFLAGTGPESELRAGVAGGGVLQAYIEAGARDLATVTGEELAVASGGFPRADAAVLVGEFAEYFAATLRRSLSSGIWGWYDDLLALGRDWEFDPASIHVPVTVWHGEQDPIVPIAHGRWLAAQIPGARALMLAEHSHLSIGAVMFPSILDDLLDRAGSKAS